jgi:hypothetical protein
MSPMNDPSLSSPLTAKAVHEHLADCLGEAEQVDRLRRLIGRYHCVRTLSHNQDTPSKRTITAIAAPRLRVNQAVSAKTRFQTLVSDRFVQYKTALFAPTCLRERHAIVRSCDVRVRARML